MEPLRQENRNALILCGIVLLLCLLLYVIYPLTKTAVSIFAIITMFSITIFSNKRFGEFGPGVSFKGKNLLWAVIVGVGTYGFFWFASRVIPGLSFGLPYLPAAVTDNIQWIIIVILAPLAEELATRGALLRFIQWAESKRGVTKLELWIAIFAQAVFFMLLHLLCYSGFWFSGTYAEAWSAIGAVSGALLTAGIFGVIFGFIAVRTKNLLTSIIAHMLINASLFVAAIVFLG